MNGLLIQIGPIAWIRPDRGHKLQCSA